MCRSRGCRPPRVWPSVSTTRRGAWSQTCLRPRRQGPVGDLSPCAPRAPGRSALPGEGGGPLTLADRTDPCPGAAVVLDRDGNAATNRNEQERTGTNRNEQVGIGATLRGFGLGGPRRSRIDPGELSLEVSARSVARRHDG